MKVSVPISFSDTDVWVFVDFGDEVQAGRVAITGYHAFAVLPECHFAVNGVVPLYPETSDPIPGMRWAETSDLAGITEFQIG